MHNIMVKGLLVHSCRVYSDKFHVLCCSHLSCRIIDISPHKGISNDKIEHTIVKILSRRSKRTLFYFNIVMFLSISFLVYSCSIFDIVLIDNKFRHKFVERLVQLWIGLGGRSNVDMVSRLYLPVNAPYFLGHVVDCEGDFYSFIESSVVHPPNLGQVEPVYLGKDCSVLEFPKVMFLLFRWKIDYAIDDKK
jgi:hypothetical protein